MRVKASLAVDRMTELQLWTSLMGHIEALDPTSFTYTPGQTVNIARQARQIALELRLRSSQLSLLHPEPQDAA